MNEQQMSNKGLVEEIGGHEGQGTELVSLYVRPDKSLSSVKSMVSQEISQSENIKSSKTRKNVKKALS